MSLTTNKNRECLNKVKENGQNECYLILSEEERSKGYVRPVRQVYVHVGKQIDTSEMRELTEAEHERYDKYGYIGYIENNDPDSAIVGRFITEEDLKPGCGHETRMAWEIAETYARNPKFYGSTFCSHCKTHLPVEEFIWKDTDEKVGS